MKWKIEISVFERDLRLLRDVLQSLGLRVLEAEGETFIAGERFDRVSSAEDVYGDALEIRENFVALES